MVNDEVVRKDLQNFRSQGFGTAKSVVYVLMETVKRSEAGTIMGIEYELRDTATCIRNAKQGSNMEVRAALETFLASIAKIGLSEKDFEAVKKSLIAVGEDFLDRADKSRERIAHQAVKLIEDGSSILTISKSRAVTAILTAAVAPPHPKDIKVFVAETRPSASGVDMAQRLRKLNIPTTLLPDAAVGSLIESIDVVLVGAEAAMENGGIVNSTGTFQLAMAAKAYNKPLYVAVERYKFSRLYPLSQKDLQDGKDTDHDNGLNYYNPPADLTPPEYITLLFTDEGVLTPAAVSDMLMRMN